MSRARRAADRKGSTTARLGRLAALVAGLWIVFGSAAWELPGRLLGEPSAAPAATVGLPGVAQASSEETEGHSEASAEEGLAEGHEGPEISHV
ncbi:MAG: hypothetical protein V3W35_08030, partial [Gemmatimonadota bacterium]